LTSGSETAALVPPPGVGFATTIERAPADTNRDAGMVTTSSVLVADCLARDVLPAAAWDCDVNPVPVIMSVTSPSPTVTGDGLKELICGNGFNTLKESDPLVPPPGVGVFTVTGCEPAVASNDALTLAVSCVALTKVVVSAVPSNWMLESATNEEPLRVSASAEEPAMTLAGIRLMAVGAGFNTVNEAEVVPPPGPGFETTRVSVPAVASIVAGTVIDRLLASMKEAVTAVPLTVTEEVGTKPAPTTERAIALDPTMAAAGDRDVTAGTGLLTVSVSVADRPPPGAGFWTAMVCTPAEATTEDPIEPLSCVLLVKVVARALPSSRSREPAMKPVPETVRVSAPEPATTVDGESAVSVGSGFGSTTVRFAALLVEPGFFTWTE
jgi:hypothetical protein